MSEIVEAVQKIIAAVKQAPSPDEVRKTLEELKFLRAHPAAARMTGRIEEMRRKDASLATKSDEVLIAKVATSRDREDQEAWAEYRAEKDGNATFPSIPGGNSKTPFSAVPGQDGQAPYPAVPGGNPFPSDPGVLTATGSPHTQIFDALVDQHQKDNPGRHRGHSVAAVMGTPEGKAAYRTMRSEHMIGMTKSLQGNNPIPMPLGEDRSRSTKYGEALENHIDAMQRDNPGMSRAVARRKVITTDKGGTLLHRHEQALRNGKTCRTT